jgi:hypothetical protein
MNHFHIWCNLKSDSDPNRFSESVREFLSYLHERELIEGYYIARRKFLLDGPPMGEFDVTVEFLDMPQVDRAFEFVAAAGDDVVGLHEPIMAMVKDVFTALYRDFPEPRKQRKLIVEN